ncbi:MAG: CPBP family intramembrane metalloprotease [Peptococcaceae bacterium]|mgnify:CR=1 FL=1|nr:CPBP family intramembrane metalloprotease [Peptococcaceae bacterium]
MEQNKDKTINRQNLTKRRLVLFVLFSIVLGWICFFLIPLLDLSYGEGLSTAILAGAMFTPTISNLLTRLITKEGFQKLYLRPNLKGNLKKYLLIFFAPTVLVYLSCVFYFLIFPHQFDPELTVLKEILAAGGSAGVPVQSLLMISILQSLLLGPVINIIPTLGEELGWRGYLLPKLREFFSDPVALVITGVIWGIWHAPVIAIGHNYGTDYPGYPWLGILAMIVFCVTLGIIEGYATIKLDSAVPAAMIHSTVNATAALPIYLAKSGYNPILGPAITGLVGGLPLMIVAVALLVIVIRSKSVTSPS